MCRLLAYKGVSITIDELLYQPRFSLIKQSYNAKELEEPLNGDGFGVGWYAPEIDQTPAVFVSTSPAWSNLNLRHIAPKIKTPLCFAHVRAASVGDISEANCHPFFFENYMCMHNGDIGGFSQIKRVVRRGLCDQIYNWIRGQTDSEHFFAVFLEYMIQMGKPKGVQAMLAAVKKSIVYIEHEKKNLGVTEISFVNAVFSDGKSIVAVRYTSGVPENALSLYYSTGSRYVCEDGICHMLQSTPDEKSILIVSEKLTEIREDWKPVPANTAICVGESMQLSFETL